MNKYDFYKRVSGILGVGLIMFGFVYISPAAKANDIPADTCSTIEYASVGANGTTRRYYNQDTSQSFSYNPNCAVTFGNDVTILGFGLDCAETTTADLTLQVVLEKNGTEYVLQQLVCGTTTMNSIQYRQLRIQITPVGGSTSFYVKAINSHLTQSRRFNYAINWVPYLMATAYEPAQLVTLSEESFNSISQTLGGSKYLRVSNNSSFPLNTIVNNTGSNPVNILGSVGVNNFSNLIDQNVSNSPDTTLGGSLYKSGYNSFFIKQETENTANRLVGPVSIKISQSGTDNDVDTGLSIPNPLPVSQSGTWTVNAVQSGSWGVSQVGSWTVNAVQSGVWAVNATLTAIASGISNAIHVIVDNTSIAVSQFGTWVFGALNGGSFNHRGQF